MSEKDEPASAREAVKRLLREDPDISAQQIVRVAQKRWGMAMAEKTATQYRYQLRAEFKREKPMTAKEVVTERPNEEKAAVRPMAPKDDLAVKLATIKKVRDLAVQEGGVNQFKEKINVIELLATEAGGMDNLRLILEILG